MQRLSFVILIIISLLATSSSAGFLDTIQETFSTTMTKPIVKQEEPLQPPEVIPPGFPPAPLIDPPDSGDPMAPPIYPPGSGDPPKIDPKIEQLKNLKKRKGNLVAETRPGEEPKNKVSTSKECLDFQKQAEEYNQKANKGGALSKTYREVEINFRQLFDDCMTNITANRSYPGYRLNANQRSLNAQQQKKLDAAIKQQNNEQRNNLMILVPNHFDDDLRLP
jgi:hypothetical protein